MPVPTAQDPDWSDSDDDERSDVETNVLLGLPDGQIERDEDIRDAAVSRIGGRPAFLTGTEPSLSSSQCKHCSFPMELLVQLWCPFEGSNMDRALYVFGCGRSECQHQPGSIRAFRGLRFNAEYAAKLEKKRQRALEKQEALLALKQQSEKAGQATKVNPFSMGSSSSVPGLFGAAPAFGKSDFGSKLFSNESEPPLDDEDEDAPPPPDSDSEDENDDPEETNSEDDFGSEVSVLAAPANVPSSSSPWLAAPAYEPAHYLSTSSEYVPPAPKVKTPAVILDDDREARVGKSKKAEAKAEKDAKWEEGYEDSMEVDKVFEKFARTAGYEGEQCIRYELGGTPLPFSRDSIFSLLFPSSSSQTDSAQGRRIYDSKSSIITPCPRCNGSRVFECQLMPHLISLLRSSELSSPTGKDGAGSKPKGASEQAYLDARKEELTRLLKGGSGRGMEWGTCMIFSCGNDCALESRENEKEAKEVWVEELVLVQWEE